MGEAKTYEVRVFGLADIISGALAELASPKISREGYAIIKATGKLIERMRDTSMLCMTCDHAFAHDEPPTEIAIGLPWEGTEDPQIVASPICANCAAADDETKLRRIKNIWLKLLKGSQCAPCS